MVKNSLVTMAVGETRVLELERRRISEKVKVRAKVLQGLL